jgi:glutathione S-transferase
MKLYYAPYTCALAPHIVALEAGLAIATEQVDLRARRTAAGDDYRAVSPLGYVPALQLDDGEVLTEGVAIMQYLADRAPGSELAPPPGTFARVRLQASLNFIATELHKTFSPWLFHSETGEAAQSYARARLRDRFALVERQLGGSEYLLGGSFTVADAYCFTIVSWSKAAGIALEQYPALASYMRRIAARPAVRDAMRSQGMLKAA